jgi:antitoxin YefM
MQVISYSEARNSLKSVLDSVNDNADVTIINRRDAGNAVVMSLDHYNSIIETLYLVQSPANAAHLANQSHSSKQAKPQLNSLLKTNGAATGFYPKRLGRLCVLANTR